MSVKKNTSNTRSTGVKIITTNNKNGTVFSDSNAERTVVIFDCTAGSYTQLYGVSFVGHCTELYRGLILMCPLAGVSKFFTPTDIEV